MSVQVIPSDSAAEPGGGMPPLRNSSHEDLRALALKQREKEQMGHLQQQQLQQQLLQQQTQQVQHQANYPYAPESGANNWYDTLAGTGMDEEEICPLSGGGGFATAIPPEIAPHDLRSSGSTDDMSMYSSQSRRSNTRGGRSRPADPNQSHYDNGRSRSADPYAHHYSGGASVTSGLSDAFSSNKSGRAATLKLTGRMLQVKLKVHYSKKEQEELYLQPTVVVLNKQYGKAGDDIPLPKEFQVYDDDGDKLDTTSFTGITKGHSLMYDGNMYTVVSRCPFKYDIDWKDSSSKKKKGKKDKNSK